MPSKLPGVSTTLVVADHRADARYHLPDGATALRKVGRGCAAEHAGLLALPAGTPHGFRYVFVDDAGGTAVFVGDDGDRAVSVAIPGEHLACTPDGRFLAVTTGFGANPDPWSDLVTIVDVTTLRSTRVRVRAGEPGLVLAHDQVTGDVVVVLRHREPGGLEAIPLQRILAAGPHCPRVRGTVITDIGDLGHGDAYDPRTGVIMVATESGLERFTVADGHIQRLEAVAWPVPGRAYHLRVDPRRRIVGGALRGGPQDPAKWTAWNNWLFEMSLDDTTMRCAAIGDGLVFRPALIADGLAATVIRGAGDDSLTVWRPDTDPHPSTTALAPMCEPPRPGHAPWDGTADRPAQRRAVASDGTRIAVTGGGSGIVEIWPEPDLSTAPLRIACPTPLHEGAQLAWICSPAPDLVDTVAR